MRSLWERGSTCSELGPEIPKQVKLKKPGVKQWLRLVHNRIIWRNSLKGRVFGLAHRDAGSTGSGYSLGICFLNKSTR
jgi:hypothetical protein